MDPLSKSITTVFFGTTLIYLGYKYATAGYPISVLVGFGIWATITLLLIGLLATVSWRIVSRELKEQAKFDASRLESPGYESITDHPRLHPFNPSASSHLSQLPVLNPRSKESRSGLKKSA